jgi:hypothetical protein
MVEQTIENSSGLILCSLRHTSISVTLPRRTSRNTFSRGVKIARSTYTLAHTHAFSVAMVEAVSPITVVASTGGLPTIEIA